MTIRTKKILVTFTTTFMLVLLCASAAFAQTKIAYVDLQRALLEVEDGKKAKAKLKKEFDAKQKELDEKQKQVVKMKETLESSAQMMTEQARQQKAMELQKKMYELQQLYMKLQGELSQKEAKATQEIFERMGAIIETIGKEKSYDLILEKTESSVLYAPKVMDITSEVIKRYNSK